MLNIKEFLDKVFEEEGYEAYEEMEVRLEEAYLDEENEEAFHDLCDELGIDLTDIEALQQWVWDFED